MLPANPEQLLHFASPIIENITVSSHVINTKHIKSGYIFKKSVEMVPFQINTFSKPLPLTLCLTGESNLGGRVP